MYTGAIGAGVINCTRRGRYPNTLDEKNRVSGEYKGVAKYALSRHEYVCKEAFPHPPP